MAITSAFEAGWLDREKARERVPHALPARLQRAVFLLTDRANDLNFRGSHCIRKSPCRLPLNW